MNGTPEWLPEPLHLKTWSHDTYDRLYQWFCSEILSAPLQYDGSKVWYFPDIEDGREALFWHLTAREDKATGDRIPDLPRCRRLPWLRPLLLNTRRPGVLGWDYLEGDGSTKTYVWLRDYDYVVIMKKYPDGSRRLVTAYCIQYSNERRKLQKKYDGRLNA